MKKIGIRFIALCIVEVTVIRSTNAPAVAPAVAPAISCAITTHGHGAEQTVEVSLKKKVGLSLAEKV